jgi:hypothetical protein
MNLHCRAIVLRMSVLKARPARLDDLAEFHRDKSGRVTTGLPRWDRHAWYAGAQIPDAVWPYVTGRLY